MNLAQNYILTNVHDISKRTPDLRWIKFVFVKKNQKKHTILYRNLGLYVKNNIGRITPPPPSFTGDHSFRKFDHRSITHCPIKLVEDTSNFLFKLKDISHYILVNSLFSVFP